MLNITNGLIPLTLPYPTKSNKRVFLLAHARSVFDYVINQIHILADGRGWAGVWFAWHAEGPGVKPGAGCDKNKQKPPIIFVKTPPTAANVTKYYWENASSAITSLREHLCASKRWPGSDTRWLGLPGQGVSLLWKHSFESNCTIAFSMTYHCIQYGHLYTHYRSMNKISFFLTQLIHRTKNPLIVLDISDKHNKTKTALICQCGYIKLTHNFL